MKNDIVPRKPVQQPVQLPQIPTVVSKQPDTPPQKTTTETLQDVTTLPEIQNLPSVQDEPKNTRLKWYILGALLFGLFIMVLFINFLLSPRDSSAKETVAVEIVAGMVPSQIAVELEKAGVIRSSLAFHAYARLTGSSLKAGNYQLSPADSVPRILTQVQAGPESDEIEVTFKPGATIAENKKVLSALGYSDTEITTAFSLDYDNPIFQDRPEGTDLEGYIFGETHRFNKGVPVNEILSRYFEDYYKVIEENDLINLYKQQGLSLYEGITLASIIQRESGGDDKAQIAQVFLLRLSEGIMLGSDVTYQYIADKEGNPRDINYDSPYNTRRYAGLPPGPIATPGVAALLAVSSPDDGDYIYFLSGDDNVTYFARTQAEHEANIRNHCQQKCSIL